jgi:hypothetical protein
VPNQLPDDLLHTTDVFELPRVRTELQSSLLVVASLAPHPVQPNTQSAGHCYFGNALFPTHGQVYISSFPIWVVTHGSVSCFHQQKTQQRIALFTDVTEPLTLGTGVLARNQAQIAAELFATAKALRCSDNQHERKRRDRTNARMGHEPLHFGPVQ